MELEYEILLYGKEIQQNMIYFDLLSKHDEYVPSKRVFDGNVNSSGETSEMYNEMIKNINRKDMIA